MGTLVVYRRGYDLQGNGSSELMVPCPAMIYSRFGFFVEQ
jgi:hypothetical protein